MTLSFIFLTAVALSLDAFAVSVSCGITQSAKRTQDKFKLAISFGLFQAFMPVISYYLSRTIVPTDWPYSGIAAFVIMTAIGIHILIEFLKKEEECGYKPLSVTRILFLSLATSIDAFAVGFTLAVMSGNIWLAAGTIGIITFILSLVGVFFGCRLGGRLKKGAELVGALMMFGLGIVFLIESLTK